MVKLTGYLLATFMQKFVGSRQFQKFIPSKRKSTIGNRSACTHSKTSFVGLSFSGHVFKCRTCNKFLFVPQEKLLRPYSQNVYTNRYYDGVQEFSPKFLNSPYVPTK